MEDLCPIGFDNVSDSDSLTEQQKRQQQQTIEYCSNIICSSPESWNSRKKSYQTQSLYKIELDKRRDKQKSRVKGILNAIKPRVYGIYIHPIFFIESDLSLDEKVFISYIMNYGAILESSDEDTTDKEFFFMSRERIIDELYWGMKMDVRKISRMKSHLIQEGILIEKKPSKELVENMGTVTGNSKCLWFSIRGYSDYVRRFRENNPFLDRPYPQEEQKTDTNIEDNNQVITESNQTNKPDVKDTRTDKTPNKVDPIKQRGIAFTQFTQTPQQRIQKLEQQLKQFIINGGKPSDPEYVKLVEEHTNLCKQYKKGKVVKRASKRQELIRDFMRKYGDKLNPDYETEGQIRTIVQDVKNTSDYAVKGLIEQFKWLDIFIEAYGLEEAQKLIQSHAYSGYSKLIYANQVPDQDVKTEAVLRRMQTIKDKYGDKSKTTQTQPNNSVDRQDYKYWPCTNSHGLEQLQELFEKAKDDGIMYEDTNPQNCTLEFVNIVCNAYGSLGSKILSNVIQEPNANYHLCLKTAMNFIAMNTTIEDYMSEKTGDKYFGIYNKDELKGSN